MPQTWQNPLRSGAPVRDQSIGSPVSAHSKMHGHARSGHRPHGLILIHFPTTKSPEYPNGWWVRPATSIRELRPSIWPRPRVAARHPMRWTPRDLDQTLIPRLRVPHGKALPVQVRLPHNRQGLQTPPSLDLVPCIQRHCRGGQRANRDRHQPILP